MKFVIDMNLPPSLCEVLAKQGWDALHWSKIGDPKAADAIIFDWARSESRVIITHDLDFSALLASTRARGPSVIQVRTQNTSLETFAPVLTKALQQFKPQLEKGALIVIDEGRARARILPIT